MYAQGYLVIAVMKIVKNKRIESQIFFISGFVRSRNSVSCQFQFVAII